MTSSAFSPASMEATNPQERKGLFWEAKVACSLKQYPTLLAELRFCYYWYQWIEVKTRSLWWCRLFSNLPVPPERWFLCKETVVPILSSGKLAALFLSRGVASLPKHSALVLSFGSERSKPSTPWNLSYGEPPGFYHGSSLIMAGGLKCFCFTSFPRAMAFPFHMYFLTAFLRW